MKVALVHELLTMRGGAERVVKIFAEMFPDAPIYTLLYDEKKLGDWFPRSRVREAIKTPFKNHHLHLKKFPRAIESFDFTGFDVVLSSSSAFAHGIITNSNPKHVCYVQSPARYLWDRTHDVLERAGRGILGPLKKRYLSKTFHTLRIWDSEAADRPDALIAASKEVQRRIELYWRRESEVIHPPIDDFWFQPSRHPTISPSTPYFFIASQLVPYKKIDLAIDACNQLKKRLIIAGDGPAKSSLKAIAGPTIEFRGFVSDEELRTLYAHATATIFPGEEDFGLVPLESLATGTPVIAYKGGGALETLKDGVTGEFFDEPTPQSLMDAIAKRETKTYDKTACRARAQEFSRTNFEKCIHRALESVVASRR